MSDKKNYAKALSAFANSAGGIIVWGIDAPSAPKGIRGKVPIRQPQVFAEHLDSLASRLVSPPVEGVENLVVREPDGSGYVVSYIPKSLHAPHRAESHHTKKYYQRSGDSFLQLEHWQLEYMFGRRLVPELRLLWEKLCPSIRFPRFYRCRVAPQPTKSRPSDREVRLFADLLQDRSCSLQADSRGRPRADFLPRTDEDSTQRLQRGHRPRSPRAGDLPGRSRDLSRVLL